MSNIVISIANEPILTFSLLLLIILVVPILFQKINLPGIVGLLIAGTVVGPNGFGLIEAAGVIDVLGKVGLLYLMFLAGLEINLDQFQKEKTNTLVFGFFTFIIPQICGTMIFLWLGYSWPASLIIASMFASHTLVAYPIITRLGLSKDKSVSAALGGTIITDTAALLVLAIVARFVEGNLGWNFWITLVLLFSLYLIFMFYLLPRISYSFFRYIGEKGRFTYVYVIGVMLLCAWLAEVIGIESIVGAFLAGLAFNRLLTNKGPLKNRVEFFGDAFFIPLFLIYVGMLVDFDVLMSSVDVWVIMGVMTGTVVLTKLAAAFLSAGILGFNTNQTWVIFGLSNSQAAATLAAVFVGLELGIIGTEILNGAIMMILITCIIGPLVVEKFGARMADETALEMESLPVIKQRILVPLANPITSARLIEFAANIRIRDQTTIYPLTVINTIVNPAAQKDRAQKIINLASGHIHAVNCDSIPLIETNLNIAEGISMAVEKNAITDIVIGWNGKISTSIRVFGSIVDQMLNTTRQQVYVCKLDQPISTFKRIRVIISPKTMHSASFYKLFTNIVHLAENLNTPIIFHLLSEETKQLSRLMDTVSSDINTSWQEYPKFEMLMEAVIADITNSDLLMVTNQRSGNYGWAYGTNLIPRLMAQKKPDNSFVVAYPFDADPKDYQIDLMYAN
jgi:Kef-type K+ transport system membrane component KefB